MAVAPAVPLSRLPAVPKSDRFKWIVVFLLGACVNAGGRLATKFGAPVPLGIALAIVSGLMILPSAVAIFRSRRFSGQATLTQDQGRVVLTLGALLAALSGVNLYLAFHH